MRSRPPRVHDLRRDPAHAHLSREGEQERRLPGHRRRLRRAGARHLRLGKVTSRHRDGRRGERGRSPRRRKRAAARPRDVAGQQGPPHVHG